MHLYLATDCQTPGCRQTFLLKYLGRKGKLKSVEVKIPAPLLIHCPACLQTHDYHSGKRHYQLERTDPPPPDFSDKI